MKTNKSVETINILKRNMEEYNRMNFVNETLSYSYDNFDACLEGNSKRQNQDKQFISKLMSELEGAIAICEACQEQNEKLERKLKKKKEQHKKIVAYTEELEEKYDELSYDSDKKERKHNRQLKKLNSKLQKKNQKIKSKSKHISSVKKDRKKLKNMLRTERYENGKNPYDFTRQGKIKSKSNLYLPQNTSDQIPSIVEADMTKYSEEEVYR